MVHSFCPPFNWGSKGGFNLNSPVKRENVRRETINKLPVEDSVAVANGNAEVYPSQSTSVGSTTSSYNTDLKKARTDSTIGIRSNQTIPDENLLKVNGNERSVSVESLNLSSGEHSPRSSTDHKDVPTTVSEILQSGPEQPSTRKEGVIAAFADTSQSIQDIKFTKYEKTSEQVDKIRAAIMANDFLKNLMDADRLTSVIEAMSQQHHAAGSLIVREGDSGSHLFVSAEGNFEVLKNNVVVKTFGQWEVFGELAILYKAKRFASIKAVSDAKVWTLERRVFQKIMVRSGRQEQEDNMRFLASVPVLQGIHPIELAKISDFLKREFFLSGTAVVRQGERGDKFYIIRGGTVAVSRREGAGPEQQVRVLARGDYFGEQALLHEDRRLATVTALPPGVECLTLDRGPFTDLLGNLKELKAIRHTAPRPSESSAPSQTFKSEYSHVELKDLEIVGTLGVGGFGRVELVQHRKDAQLTFALKCLKKVEMVQQQQQDHAFNEKHIMMSCNSPFICRLYKTFRDNKFIYFLMEPVLGGDVWTALQRARHFSEPTARFMAACVLEAFHYMHGRGMIFRDLKPENLMIDSNGYVKLVDFGFAKKISIGTKTWTFAGTPEYVAPEIVLNKGHDRAVDYWALGVFIHELLVGKPPFRGADHMKTYALILRGVDAVTFHPRVTRGAQALIRRLCRAVPAERIGYLKNGVKDIKNHKWFLGFEWDKLREQKMKAPLVRPIKSNTDLTNFEKYPKDKLPPDETSGWDVDF